MDVLTNEKRNLNEVRVASDPVAEVVDAYKREGRFFVGTEGVLGREISYQEIREKTITELAEFGIDTEGTKEWFTKNLDAAQRVYDFARANKPTRDAEQLLDEPGYHDVNHVEMVMTNTLVAFLAIKRAEASFDELTDDQKRLVGVGYGREGVRLLGDGELKSLLTYQAFHEAGEWWPRMVKTEELGHYKDTLQGELNALADGGVRVPYISEWNVKVREMGVKADGREFVQKEVVSGVLSGSLEAIMTNLKTDAVGQVSDLRESGLDAGGAYAEIHGKRSWVEFGFDVVLPQSVDVDGNGKIAGSSEQSKAMSDASFTKAPRNGGEYPDEAKSIILGRLARVGDLSQITDKSYAEKVMVTKGDGQQVEVPKSGLMLYAEFARFMPHGTESYGWSSPDQAGAGKFFAEVLVGKNSIQPEMAQILSRFKPEGIPVDYVNLYNRFMVAGGSLLRA